MYVYTNIIKMKGKEEKRDDRESCEQQLVYYKIEGTKETFVFNLHEFLTFFHILHNIEISFKC